MCSDCLKKKKWEILFLKARMEKCNKLLVNMCDEF